MSQYRRLAPYRNCGNPQHAGTFKSLPGSSAKPLKIVREHTLGVEEARRRVDQIADELGAKLRLKHRWEGDHLRVSGTGVSGVIVVEENLVEVHVRMGLGMMVFRESIRSAIEDSIDDYIV